MPSPDALHVYQREINAAERTSLSVLTAHIAPGARVLDLGCGSGAIGRFLGERDGAAAGAIDGLTISEEEAQLAAPDYRRVEVANLETAELDTLFEAHAYDAIVCADVLEHIRHPERVLAACRALLAEGGRAFLSIPNAGYAGLLAELLAGEFRYRPEGLLDETHLRFFTRRALMRLLHECRWQPLHVEVVQRALNESEFAAAFDALPPAVARYLLALPDALSYQFIVLARPLAEGEEAAPPPPDATETLLPAQALFTAQLYLGRKDGAGEELHWDEEDKTSASGTIGEERQTLSFTLPADDAPGTLAALRLDPADRPGFVHLYTLELLDAAGERLWQWSAADAEAMERAAHGGLVMQAGALASSAFTLLLYDDDPWLQLPIPTEAVARAAGGQLRATLGWPMSADFLALAGHYRLHIASVLREARAWQDERAQLVQRAQQREQLVRRNQHLEKQIRQQQALLHEVNAAHGEAMKLLHDIQNSRSFRATRPLVHAKERVDRLLGTGLARPGGKRSHPQPLPAPETPVDIIVPVYKGLEDTRRCLESVLAAPCRTPWRLIVIDDASPEPELSAWLREFAQRDERIQLLVNEENLGFVATVNRGMRESSANDVLLLNNDTEVAGDWLDRLRAAAYSDQRVASVTPFSNNATICSWPKFCKDNELPAGWDCERIDALMARVNASRTVDVPTGVGFCMYIRRAALEAVGLFDEEHFGKGYGEENDFCCRATRAGWRHLHALDTFVQHYGGVSFGDTKKPREAAAMQTLRRLHPDYEARVQRFLTLDPARLARARAIAASATDGSAPVICAVLHGRGGGTERHVWELAAHLGTQAHMLALQPLGDQCLLLRLGGASPVCDLVFTLPGDESALLDVLHHLQVRHIHYHHLVGHGDFVRELPTRLGVSYDFTAHDFFTLCPQISLTDWQDRYCGEAGEAQCTQCLMHNPAPDGNDIATWRRRHAAFLEDARYVIAPSRDALTRLARLAPAAQLALVPHTDIAPDTPLPAPAPAPLTNGRPLKVAVIGAMSRIKGADTLEAVAVAARKADAPVQFHLLGYAYCGLKTEPNAALTIFGRYDETALPHLIKQLQPDLVWFPAQWPETYSYTLSACLLAGLPVVAPNLGAFPERLAGRAWSWLCDWQQTPQQWLDFFVHIRDTHFATGQPPAPCPPMDSISAFESVRAFPPQPSAQWYRSTYLEGIAPCDGTRAPSDAILLAHLRDYDSGARNIALTLITRLRAMPLLAPLVRAIPSRWHARIKAWLSW